MIGTIKVFLSQITIFYSPGMHLLYDINFLHAAITLAANAYVGGICFRAFNRRRHSAFLLLAISCSIAVVGIVLNTVLSKHVSTQEEALFNWQAMTALWTVDIILFAIAVPKLVHLALFTLESDR